MFPWASYAGRNKLTRIGSSDADFLDVVVFDGNRICIVILDDASGNRDLGQFPLLTDDYELAIQIGSQSEAFTPTCVILRIETYVENYKQRLRVTMLNYAQDCLTRLE